MKRLILAFTLMLLALAAAARANVLPIITDVATTRTPEQITISYDVDDLDGDALTVILIVPAAALRLDAPTEAVAGDIGPGVGSGEEKRITIDLSALADTLPAPFVPRLMAYDGRGFGAEMIYVASPVGPDFLVDKFEVTNEQFAAFVRADGYEMMEYWIVDDGSIEIEETGWNYCGRFRWSAPRHWDLTARPPWSADEKSSGADTPVLGLSWFEAHAYCRWAGRRLPVGSEWREAAGLLEHAYPWGEDPIAASDPPFFALANLRFGFRNYDYRDFTIDGFEYAAPVGSFSPLGDSPFGLCDTAGNVWEWCQDPVTVVDYTTYSCATRLLMGGSWATGIPELTEPPKDLCPLYRPDTAGFRSCFQP
jgi:formylglycine-generating enzyme required for sulfatase activity